MHAVQGIAVWLAAELIDYATLSWLVHFYMFVSGAGS